MSENKKQYKVSMLPDSYPNYKKFTWLPDEVYESNKEAGFTATTAKYTDFPDLPSPKSPPASPVGTVANRRKTQN